MGNDENFFTDTDSTSNKVKFPSFVTELKKSSLSEIEEKLASLFSELTELKGISCNVGSINFDVESLLSDNVKLEIELRRDSTADF